MYVTITQQYNCNMYVTITQQYNCNMYVTLQLHYSYIEWQITSNKYIRYMKLCICLTLINSVTKTTYQMQFC